MPRKIPPDSVWFIETALRQLGYRPLNWEPEDAEFIHLIAAPDDPKQRALGLRVRHCDQSDDPEGHFSVVPIAKYDKLALADAARFNVDLKWMLVWQFGTEHDVRRVVVCDMTYLRRIAPAGWCYVDTDGSGMITTETEYNEILRR